MDNLKLKIKDTNIETPVSLIVGVLVIIIGLSYLIFSDTSLKELWETGLQIWRDIKK